MEDAPTRFTIRPDDYHLDLAEETSVFRTV
jgi:hypothetical protein